MSSLIAFLIAFPLVIGAVLLLVTRASVRNPIVLASSAVIIVASIAASRSVIVSELAGLEIVIPYHLLGQFGSTG